MERPSFVASQVQFFTGIAPESLRKWRHRHLLPFSRAGVWGGPDRPEDAQRWERFSATEVAALACMHDLMLAGLSVSDASHIIRDKECRDVILKQMAGGRSGPDQFVLTWRYFGAEVGDFKVGDEAAIFDEIGRERDNHEISQAFVVLNLSATCRRVRAKVSDVD